jgi:S-DNA-T family DNA segregation ATPase FtsK/SpoIIIE
MSKYSKVVKRKKKKSRQFIPESTRVFIARRIIDLVAGIFVVSSACLVLAVLSYSHADPSFNTASALPENIHNWLGLTGAYIADFFLQTIGLSCFVLAFILAVWGFRVWFRSSLSPFWARFSTAIIAIMLATITLARLPSGEWLLHPYLGGSAGTLMLDTLAQFFQSNGLDQPHTTVSVASLFLCLGAIVHSCAVTKTELVSFARSTGNILRNTLLACVSYTVSVYEWIKYYGDPEYSLPERAAKKPKVKADRQVKKAAALIPDTSPQKAEPVFETASQTDIKRDIKVINTLPKAPKSSARFNNSGDSWELPPVEILNEISADEDHMMLDEEALRHNADLLQSVLSDFNISGEITSIHPGPVVTLYELEPAPGTKTSRVIGLADDIARSMSAVSVRCAVIPGRNVIGIELPNAKRQTVYLRELLETQSVQTNKAHLPLVLGKDIGGSPVVADLAKMPHLLIAGTTGSGKSVAINTMVMSLVYYLPPEKCRLIMIDPKMLELSVYDDIPHLLSPVVTEPGKAVVSLKWTVQEMENRYRSMSKLGVRNIEGYNARLAEARKKGETLKRKVQTGFDPETGKPVFEEQPMDMTELPYIVVIVDEFADLMLVAGKDVESAVQRLAQMARAAGIHLIMATQRPSTDVITGVIKANFPTRISFQVTSVYDSRTILGETGAEQLLGMGDMLYMAPGGRIKRVHGPFVADEEVENVVTFLKEQGEPQYLEEITEGVELGDSEIMSAMFGEEGKSGDKVDELYDEAVALVARERKASTSFIQRYLQIGYNRAARIIEEMERQGVVTKASPTGKRDVLVGDLSDA